MICPGRGGPVFASPGQETIRRRPETGPSTIFICGKEPDNLRNKSCGHYGSVL